MGKRQIGLWIDDLQTPHGNDYQEATSATEYYGWDSSEKYGEEFDAFLSQMALSQMTTTWRRRCTKARCISRKYNQLRFRGRAYSTQEPS